MTGELSLERSALRVHFASDPTLKSFADLYAIEAHSSPAAIEKAFVEEVKDSQVLVLLLNKILRPAVAKEFQTAKENGVRPLVFIRDRTDGRDTDLNAFIANEAYQFHCGSFSNEFDLCEKVRAAILDDLLNTYRRTEPSRPIEAQFVQLSKSPTDGSPLFSASDLDELLANPKVAEMSSADLVTVAILHSTEKWDYKTALMLIELAIRKDPKNWQAFHNKAQLLTDVGMEGQALLFLNRALELNPQSHPTFHNLGIHYYRKGKAAEARGYFLKALELFPNKHSSLSYLINIAFQEKNYAEAETLARRAYGIEPGELERGNLALAIALNGHVADAKKYLLDWDSKSKEFLRVSAYIAELEDDIPAALDYIDEFSKVYGLEHQLCVKRAFLLLADNKLSELKAWLTFAEENIVFRASDYNNLGWNLYQATLDNEFAAELFEKALLIDPTEVASWKNLQCCYLDLNALPKAIEVSRRALKYHPNDPGIFNNMTQALLRSGRFTEFGEALVGKVVSAVGGGLSAEQQETLKREIRSNPAFQGPIGGLSP